MPAAEGKRDETSNQERQTDMTTVTTVTNPQIIQDVLTSLDNLLAPGDRRGGPGLANFIMNYPNLSKIRRVIGGDDAEINELLLEKEQRTSIWHNENQARHREVWKAKLKYDKEKGKLTVVEKQVYDLLKSGGHWRMQDIVAKFISISSKALPDILSQIENILYELECRGLIVQTTNRINRKPEEPYRFKWFVVSKDERRIFAGLKPSAAYMKNTPKLEVRHVNVRDELAKSKMHAT
jgi:hypothetical protein